MASQVHVVKTVNRELLEEQLLAALGDKIKGVTIRPNGGLKTSVNTEAYLADEWYTDAEGNDKTRQVEKYRTIAQSGPVGTPDVTITVEHDETLTQDDQDKIKAIVTSHDPTRLSTRQQQQADRQAARLQLATMIGGDLTNATIDDLRNMVVAMFKAMSE